MTTFIRILGVHPHWISPLRLYSDSQRVEHEQNGSVGLYELKDGALRIEWERYQKLESFYKVGDRYIQESLLDATKWSEKSNKQKEKILTLEKLTLRKCTPTSRPYLLCIRTGPEQDFLSWFSESAQRSWDLFISSYAQLDSTTTSSADIITYGGLTKFSAMHEAHRLQPDLFGKYEAVAVFDDDVQIKFEDVDKLFDIFSEFGLALAQPSVSHLSYVSWNETFQCPAFKMRFTNFVEVMAPVFARKALSIAIPTFKMSLSSWGLDFLWPHVIGVANNNIAIIDAITVRHTKPVDLGSGAFYNLLRLIGVDAEQEMNQILWNFGLRDNVQMLGAVLWDGRVVDFVERRT
jgi:hypothetical protein